MFSLNFFIASSSVCAPFTTEGMPAFPTYSRMVVSWPVVGGSSVMLSSNSCCRVFFVWVVWSLAWSSVAVSVAVADNCFRSVATLVDAGELALWNKVTMSRGLCYKAGVNIFNPITWSSRLPREYTAYKSEHLVGL